jgi:hypothetical protein
MSPVFVPTGQHTVYTISVKRKWKVAEQFGLFKSFPVPAMPSSSGTITIIPSPYVPSCYTFPIYALTLIVWWSFFPVSAVQQNPLQWHWLRQLATAPDHLKATRGYNWCVPEMVSSIKCLGVLNGCLTHGLLGHSPIASQVATCFPGVHEDNRVFSGLGYCWPRRLASGQQPFGKERRDDLKCIPC